MYTGDGNTRVGGELPVLRKLGGLVPAERSSDVRRKGTGWLRDCPSGGLCSALVGELSAHEGLKAEVEISKAVAEGQEGELCPGTSALCPTRRFGLEAASGNRRRRGSP